MTHRTPPHALQPTQRPNYDVPPAPLAAAPTTRTNQSGPRTLHRPTKEGLRP